jgi:hypothetical protein
MNAMLSHIKGLLKDALTYLQDVPSNRGMPLCLCPCCFLEVKCMFYDLPWFAFPNILT